MACTNAPIAGADIHVEGVHGTRLEAYADGIDIMQDVPGDGPVGLVYLRWEHVPRLLRAVEEMMAAQRAFAANQGHEE
jgi:hypothetical protein